MGSLVQNLSINAPTLWQLSAASAAFDCDAELGKHLEAYAKSRDVLSEVRQARQPLVISPPRGDRFCLYHSCFFKPPLR